jgi:FkbM family methyltransferase
MLSQIKTLIPTSARANIGRAIRNLKRRPAESFGLDFIAELKSRLPQNEIRTIFDVGAHIGITALEYSDAFPAAEIHAFEPSTSNFERMKSNLVGKPDIKLHRLGMGAEQSSSTLYLDPIHPSMARLYAHPEGQPEHVIIDTIDNFCQSHRIQAIDILKIDTEGHELQVLEGANKMLSASKIAIIKAEVAIDPDSNYDTQLFDFSNALHPFGYRLFGFYDQAQDTLNPGPRMRRFDVSFLSESLIR